MTLMKNMGGGGVMVNQPSPGSAFHRAAESPNYPLHVQLLTNSPFSIPFVLIFMHRIGGVEVPIHPQRSDARTTILRSIPFPFILFRSHCQKHADCGFTSHRPTPALSGPPVTSHGSPVISLSPGSSLPDRLPVPRTCILRTIGANRSLQQTAYGSPFLLSFAWEGVMGKFSRSWELVKQSFAILRSDKQLMLFPVLSAIACLLVTAIIATGGAVLMVPAMTSAAAAGERFNPNQSPVFLLGMFSLYVANYFVIVFFNVALVGVANSRLMGGTWTFRDGIELAWARKGTIFQWALVAATVGVILRTLEERMGLIGRIIMRIIGVAWALACYFVVPVLAFEDLTPIAAVKRSSKLFRDTWGEKVIGGFSFGLVSFVLMLPGFGLWFVAIVLGGIKGLVLGFALLVLYLLMLSVMMSAVQGIFNAALYRYACFKQVPPAFDAELVTSAWAPKS